MSNLLKAFFALIALFLLYTYAQSVYKLVSKTYFIDENKLHKLDTFHLYNRAYITSDGAGRNDRRQLQIQFQSTNGYSFSISKNVYKAIINKQQLEKMLLIDDNNFVANTTLYHDVTFIPYTTKEYFEQYKTTGYPVFIEVYQLQMDNKKYIDINTANGLEKAELKKQALRPAVIAVVISLVIIIKPIRKQFSKLFQPAQRS